MNILITGCAGFIGYHVAHAYLQAGHTVIGIDNLNDYYDVSLKKARLAQLTPLPRFTFYPADITQKELLDSVFKQHACQRVVHLAAQAGVRYSIQNPHAYVHSNLAGFTYILEACAQHKVEHLIYASSSSVYGANTALPYHEDAPTNHPLAMYAATKKANELMAHAYSHLYQLPTTGLRFFTVYGPWGRPDMAFFSFTRDMLAGKPIKIYNHGHMMRDFTYIDDIVAGILLAVEKIPCADPAWSGENPLPSTGLAPYRIYNIGCGRPVRLMDYIQALESAIGKEAIKEFMPIQEGDVLATHADITRLREELGYSPKVNVMEGVARFVDWYLGYYHPTGSSYRPSSGRNGGQDVNA